MVRPSIALPFSAVNLPLLRNEEFEFAVPQEAKDVLVDCYDWDRFGKDDLIGRVTVPLAVLKANQGRMKPYKLMQGHAERGEILMSIQLTSLSGDNPFALRDALAEFGDEQQLKPTSDQIRVKVDYARSLLAMDANGKSDPYVRIICGSFVAKTTVKKKTVDPTWYV